MKLRLLSIAACILAFAAISAATPKYIFYFIGDGMGPGQIMSTENYNRLVLNHPQLPMTRFPVNSYVTTFSASSPVTDSAAAGTALSTGSKTRNGMLGMNADTIPVTSVAKYLHDDGYGVGILTTVALDDATPGAFYAHVPNRGMSYEIGRDAADCDYEILAGYKLRGYTKDGQPDLRDVFKQSGVELLYGVDALAGTDARRVILLPEPSTSGFSSEYDVDDYEGNMSLESMLTGAIDHLMKHTPEKFFIMAEGGSIDHACHANDGGTAIKEVIAFNKAISKAIEFYLQHPDETLIVVTADHETGGMSVGNAFTGYGANLAYFLPQKMSKERFNWLCDQLKKRDTKVTWQEMQGILAENLGFYDVMPVTDEENERLGMAFNKDFVEGSTEREQTLYASVGSFPVEVFQLLNKKAGIGWTAYSHSGNFVPLYAIGVGSDLFTGNNDNTQVPLKILTATQR